MSHARHAAINTVHGETFEARISSGYLGQSKL
jgi:hypothetical protein